jgi:hypothetical protein
MNSVGGLNPNTVAGNLTGSLQQYWKILDRSGHVLNWNGVPSPVVHQIDHFIDELSTLVPAGEKSCQPCSIVVWALFSGSELLFHAFL